MLDNVNLADIQSRQWPQEVLEDVWGFLSEAFHKETTVLNTRISPENLKNLYVRGLSIVKFLHDEMVGHICAWPVADGFFEVGSVWVRPDLRTHGVGNSLFEEIKELAQLNNGIVFNITISPYALKAGARVDFNLHQDWAYPVPWHLTCAPCDLLPEKEKHSCPKRNISCWLRVMQHDKPRNK